MKGTEVFKLGAILYQMMTRQTMPDPEECTGTYVNNGITRNCQVKHWEQTTNTPCSAWNGGTFKLSDKLEALVEGYDETQPKVGYSSELVELVGQLMGNYRRTVDTTMLFTSAKEAYLEWKAETPEGQQYVDHWDDEVQRETNSAAKDDAEMERACAQSSDRAVDYVQMALGGVGRPTAPRGK